MGLHAHYCADEGPLVYTCRGLNIALSVAIEVCIVQLEVQMVGGHIHVWLVLKGHGYSFCLLKPRAISFLYDLYLHTFKCASRTPCVHSF